MFFEILFTASIIYGISVVNQSVNTRGNPDLFYDMLHEPIDSAKLVPERERHSNSMDSQHPTIPDSDIYFTNSGIRPNQVQHVHTIMAERVSEDFDPRRFPVDLHDNMGVYVDSIGKGANPSFENRNINI